MLDIMMIYVLPLIEHFFFSAALTWYICRFGIVRISPGWVSAAGFCFVWAVAEDTLHRFDVDFFWTLIRDAGMLFLLPILISIFFRVSWDKRIFISISYCTIALAARYFFIGLARIFSFFQQTGLTDDEIVHFSIEQMKRWQWKIFYGEAIQEIINAFF